MHSADYAVARCLSVRPSVRLPSVHLPHAGIVSKQLHISSKFFSPWGSLTILFFRSKRDGNIPTGTPWTAASNARGVWKKSRFLTNISLYLANDARYSHSDYGRRIGNHTQAFEWYGLNDFEWPLTHISRSRYHSTSNNSKRDQIELYLQWRTNRKSHMVYRTAPFSVTLNNPQPSFQGHAILWRWISHKRLKIRP